MQNPVHFKARNDLRPNNSLKHQKKWGFAWKQIPDWNYHLLTLSWSLVSFWGKTFFISKGLLRWAWINFTKLKQNVANSGLEIFTFPWGYFTVSRCSCHNGHNHNDHITDDPWDTTFMSAWSSFVFLSLQISLIGQKWKKKNEKKKIKKGISISA